LYQNQAHNIIVCVGLPGKMLTLSRHFCRKPQKAGKIDGLLGKLKKNAQARRNQNEQEVRDRR
jgi:hypothetical protein